MRIVRWLQSVLWVASAMALAYTAWVFTGRILDRKRLEARTKVAPKAVEAGNSAAQEGPIDPEHALQVARRWLEEYRARKAAH